MNVRARVLALPTVALAVAACAHAPAAPVPPAPIDRPTPVEAPTLPPPVTVARTLRPSADFIDAARRLDEEVHRWLGAEGAARQDGYVYGDDVAALLLYAVRRGDRPLYLALVPEVRRLTMLDASDPYTRGFVLWRKRSGVKPDVSGAAEARAMAQALWEGAQAFDRAEDRSLASTIMDGYARHAWEQDGVWIVRKYFAFAGRSFASLSGIAAYDPDFLADLGAARGGAWPELAERSYAAVERAETPAGLLAPILQPEVAATYPELGLAAYSPNGVASLLDACLAAEGAVRGRPALADGLLELAGHRSSHALFGRLYAYFRADDGEPVGPTELPTSGHACLARLAAARENRTAFEKLEAELIRAMRDVARVPRAQVAPLHDGASLLLAAHAAGAFEAR